MPAYTPQIAKLVATPTDAAWAQAYNAGALYAVLALSTSKKTDEDLKTLGKKVFSTLQSEFFPLEEKTLHGIKEAVIQAVADLPKNVTISFAVAYCKEDVLYVYIAGSGKILLKRDDALGVLLNTEEETKEVLSASGKLQDKDILILQTTQCTEVISEDSLAHGLEDNLTDSAEALMPQLQANEDGGAAALLLKFNKDSEEAVEEEALYAIPVPKKTDDPEKEPEDSDEPEDRTTERFVPSTLPPRDEKPLDEEPMTIAHTNRMAFLKNLGSKRVLLSLLAIILAGALVTSIFIVQTQQEQQKRKTSFDAVYKEAKDAYDKAEDLAGLNESIARDDYTKAKNTIEKRINEFPEGTEERAKLNELLTQINDALGPEDQGKETKTTAVSDDASPLLAIAKASKASFVASDDSERYYATDKGIYRQDAPDDKPEILVENDNDWTTIGGFSVYNGNLYLVDTPSGILKFVAGSSGYGKSNYFTPDTQVDVKNVVSMAIDSSVWLLRKDGSIQKFTKGTQDTFKISALPRPFVSPTTIFTNQDTENLYVLDTGTSSIIVLTKDGTYATSYSAAILKNAKAIDVSETDKKVFVLSENKIWEFPLD